MARVSGGAVRAHAASLSRNYPGRLREGRHVHWDLHVQVSVFFNSFLVRVVHVPCFMFDLTSFRTLVCLFCSVLFCSVLFCSVLFCSVLFCSVLFCSVLFLFLFLFCSHYGSR